MRYLLPFLIVLLSGPAWGQTSCNNRAAALANLAEKHQERPVAGGISLTGNLVQVTATEDGATWSIIVTEPNGNTCIIGAGEWWRMQEWKPVEPKT